MKRQKNNKRIAMEQLEGRDLFAGDVLAFLSSGNLNVVEASGQLGRGQAVQVSQLADGRLRVQGLSSQDGGMSLINGQAFVDFNVPGDLLVNLGAGNDTVKLARNANFRNVNLEMSASNAVAAADIDAVIVEGIKTTGNLSIKTGVGADFFDIFDATIGDNYGIDNLSINSGAGRDHIDIFSSTRGVTVYGNLTLTAFQTSSEADIDEVFIQSLTVRDNLSVSTGGGDDSVDMSSIYAGGDIVVSTDAGKDVVDLNELRSGDDFWVLLGSGDDTLSTQYLNSDQLTLDGGEGFDRLSEAVPGNSNRITRMNFEPAKPYYTSYEMQSGSMSYL